MPVPDDARRRGTDGEAGSGPAVHAAVDGFDVAVDEGVDEMAVLEEEIERLRQRVIDLEVTVTEYRSQMSQVLSSGSWRLTSPIRATVSRYRTARVRARRAARRIRGRVAADGGQRVPTAGLFMPDLATLPEGSPLRRGIDVGSLRRPPEADGPLTRPEGDPRVLVVAHVHYPELWDDIDDRLVRMPEAYDLLVTVTEGTATSVIPRIMSRHPQARIEVVPNRGRDWAPLVRLANRGLLSGYDAVAKVHTKKSEHRIDGDSWRLALLDGVFESPDAIRRTIDLLREDRTVGLVVPTGHVTGTEHWGSNQAIVEALACRLPMAFDPDELRFPAGSMFWCRPWLLERIADLDITDEHFEPEAGQHDATTAHALERMVGIYAAVAGMDAVEAMDVSSRLRGCRRHPHEPPRVYAFYLPQYHQCPENDEFWGEGFTDWVNVRRARPLFEGHRQPILPSDEVGFYDLGDPEVLREQARTARAHGIDGFVFHHYWFDGRTVLDTPISNWLHDPTIDLPLAINWANEPWTRRWDGLESEVLIPQAYGDRWADRFWDDISAYLQDPRYIRFDGAPILLVYRLGEIPDAADAIRAWRRRAADDGHAGLRVLAVAPSRECAPLDPSLLDSIDGIVGFPPGSGIRIDSLASMTAAQVPLGGDVMSYGSAQSAEGPSLPASSVTYPGVMPGWDNTARRGTSAYAFHGANPVTWASALRRAGRAQGDAVFVNAWNEWAEGACLESGQRFGSGYQRTLREALGRSGDPTR